MYYHVSLEVIKEILQRHGLCKGVANPYVPLRPREKQRSMGVHNGLSQLTRANANTHFHLTSAKLSACNTLTHPSSFTIRNVQVNELKVKTKTFCHSNNPTTHAYLQNRRNTASWKRSGRRHQSADHHQNFDLHDVTIRVELIPVVA